MSQRDEIATIVVEALKAWTDGGPEPSNAIADALLAAGLLVPPEPYQFVIDGVTYDGRIILAEWTAYQEAAAKENEAR